MPADETDRPANHAIVPDIYVKLDVDLRKKTRVMNSQLDNRLVLQEKVITKYRKAALRFHYDETCRVRRELIKIKTKLPEDRHHCMGYYTRRQKIPRKMRGIPGEKVYMPFCARHYIHHLPTKKQHYQALPFHTLRIADSHIAVDADRTEAFGGVVAMDKMNNGSKNANMEITIHRPHMKKGKVYPLR